MGQSATILKGVRNEKNDGKSPYVSKSKTTLMVNTVRTVKKKTEQLSTQSRINIGHENATFFRT